MKLKDKISEAFLQDGFIRIKTPKGEVLDDSEVILISSCEDENDEDYRIAEAVITLPVMIKK